MSKRKCTKNKTLTKKKIKYVRTEALAALTVITDFRNATSCSSVDKCLSRIQRHMMVHPKHPYVSTKTKAVNDTIQ